jgi:hypothetical protein
VRAAATTVSLAVGAVLLSCSGGPSVGVVGDDGRTTIDEVTLAVPAGWEATDVDPPEGVLAAYRWRPDPAEPTGLQLVLGCGGTAAELAEGAVSEGRGVLGVTEAAETEGLEVPGLDEARTLVLDLAAPVGAGDVGDLRAAGLYGQAGEGLVLLELSQPRERFEPALAEEVFTSLEVDGDALGARCEAR